MQSIMKRLGATIFKRLIMSLEDGDIIFKTPRRDFQRSWQPAEDLGPNMFRDANHVNFRTPL